MPALTQQRISVSIPSRSSRFLTREAKRQNTSISKIMADIIEEYRELKEDLYFSQLADERAETCTGTVSMEEAWKIVNAL